MTGADAAAAEAAGAAEAVAVGRAVAAVEGVAVEGVAVGRAVAAAVGVAVEGVAAEVDAGRARQVSRDRRGKAGVNALIGSINRPDQGERRVKWCRLGVSSFSSRLF
jgi:hypothetical protein